MSEKKSITDISTISALGNLTKFSLGNIVSSIDTLNSFLTYIFLGTISDNSLILDAAAFGVTFSNMIGCSVGLGLGGALMTLASQANGAKNYSLVGIYLQRAIVVTSTYFLLIVLPSSFFFKSAALSLGFDEEVIDLAEEYIMASIPGVWFFLMSELLRSYLNAQGIYTITMYTSTLSTVSHACWCWLLIVHYGLGVKGAGMAFSLSYGCRMLFLATSIRLGGYGRKTWVCPSIEAFRKLKEYLSVGIFTTIMEGLEWWAFELMTIQAAYIMARKEDLSILATNAIIGNIFFLFYLPSIGVQAAASSYVGNTLGEGNVATCRRYASLTSLVNLSLVIPVETLLYIYQVEFISLFTNDQKTIELTQQLLILALIGTLADNLQGALGGVMRGLGYFTLPCVIYLIANFCIGHLLGFTLWFFYDWGLESIWIGFTISASLVFVSFLLLLAFKINFDELASKAQKNASSQIVERTETEEEPVRCKDYDGLKEEEEFATELSSV